MSTMLERNVHTPRTEALCYEMVRHGRKVGDRQKIAYWTRCWLVEVVEGDGEAQFAILERRARRSVLAYDYLRFSNYQFTDWSDPLRYLTAPPTQCLPNEHGLSGRIVEMVDGYFTFGGNGYRARQRPAPITGRVLRSLLYVRETER